MKQTIIASWTLCLWVALSAPVAAQTVVVSGNATTYLTQSLDALEVEYTVQRGDWAEPGSADILIMGRDGGTSTGPDYTGHLDNGGHILMIGGTNSGPYYTWLQSLIDIHPRQGWRQSPCQPDWTNSDEHPLTAFLPEVYDFSNQSATYKMVVFPAEPEREGQTSVGQTCDEDPNKVITTREFPSGGTFTYMAFDLGNYGNAQINQDFVIPFFQGYLGFVEGGFDNPPPIFEYIEVPAQVAEGDTTILRARGFDIDQEEVTIRWDLDNDGEFDDAQGEEIEFTAVDGNQTLLIGIQARDRFRSAIQETRPLQILNLPPAISTEPGLEAQPLVPWLYAIEASDPAGEADPIEFVLTQSPSGMFFHEGALRWVPSTQQIGQHEVAVEARDDDGGFVEQRWTLTVLSDQDGDRIIDDEDNCPTEPNADQTDTDDDGQGDVCDPDVEGDGVDDDEDNCPLIANPDQDDADDDGQGDECDPDDDNDFVNDDNDNCPLTPNPSQSDADADGQGDDCDPDYDRDQDGVLPPLDNCPETTNPTQTDTDDDGLGDACDDDDDNDELADEDDNCPTAPNPDQTDTDGDGQGDECDDDDDNDGVQDRRDNCPLVDNPDQTDTNRNGVGAACEDEPDVETPNNEPDDPNNDNNGDDEPDDDDDDPTPDVTSTNDGGCQTQPANPTLPPWHAAAMMLAVAFMLLRRRRTA